MPGQDMYCCFLSLQWHESIYWLHITVFTSVRWLGVKARDQPAPIEKSSRYNTYDVNGAKMNQSISQYASPCMGVCDITWLLSFPFVIQILFIRTPSIATMLQVTIMIKTYRIILVFSDLMKRFISHRSCIYIVKAWFCYQWMLKYPLKQQVYTQVGIQTCNKVAS